MPPRVRGEVVSASSGPTCAGAASQTLVGSFISVARRAQRDRTASHRRQNSSAPASRRARPAHRLVGDEPSPGEENSHSARRSPPVPAHPRDPRRASTTASALAFSSRSARRLDAARHLHAGSGSPVRARRQRSRAVQPPRRLRQVDPRVVLHRLGRGFPELGPRVERVALGTRTRLRSLIVAAETTSAAWTSPAGPPPLRARGVAVPHEPHLDVLRRERKGASQSIGSACFAGTGSGRRRRSRSAGRSRCTCGQDRDRAATRAVLRAIACTTGKASRRGQSRRATRRGSRARARRRRQLRNAAGHNTSCSAWRWRCSRRNSHARASRPHAPIRSPASSQNGAAASAPSCRVTRAARRTEARRSRGRCRASGETLLGAGKVACETRERRRDGGGPPRRGRPGRREPAAHERRWSSGAASLARNSSFAETEPGPAFSHARERLRAVRAAGARAHATTRRDPVPRRRLFERRGQVEKRSCAVAPACASSTTATYCRAGTSHVGRGDAGRASKAAAAASSLATDARASSIAARARR